MKCSECGNEIPSESRFCLSCGQPVSVEGHRTSPAVVPPRKRIGIAAAIVGLCIVAAVAFALMNRGKVTEATPVPSPQQAPVLNAPQVPSGPQPNVMQTEVQKPAEPPKENPGAPAEVVAYLEHLKKVEQMRRDVSAKELNDLVARAPELIAKAYPFDEDFDEQAGAKELANQASQFTREWQEISAYFLSVRVPQPCAQLASKYYESLKEFVGFMGSFQEAVTKSDLAKLREIKREQVSMDQKLRAADQELGRVCSQYGVEKTFTIQSDTGQTPLMGF